MRITRHSPQHITVRSDEAVMWIMSIIFIVVAGAMLLIFGKKVTLNCNRSLPPAGSCTLETTSFIDRRNMDFSLGELQQAVIDVSASSDGDTYRVVLVTAHGEIPFTDYFSSGYSGKQELADEINNYLRSTSQQSLSVKSDDRLIMSILAGVFGGAGGLMLLFSGVTTIDLDRSTGLMTVTKRRLIGSGSDEYLIGDFTGAEIEGSSKGNYRVVLRLRDGRSIPLTSYYSSGYDGKRKLADELQGFTAGGGYAPVPDELFPG